MAKKKQPKNTPKFYIYYDKKTGEILCVSNEADSRFESGIESPFEDVENFLSGKWKFSDYQVGYNKDSKKVSILSLTNEYSGYVFKNTVFEWITEGTVNPDCLVEWNGAKNEWNFFLSSDFKRTYNTVLTPKLVFFVTLENDFDFLIRTIFISTQDLLQADCVTVPFESKSEYKIEKIAISSKLVFQSYGLRIKHE
jgi:hypothetical protein